MFEKFGEFGSVEELNACAKGFKDEGDDKSLIALAIENGLEEDDALDYFEDAAECFATPQMAALGRLFVEENSYEKVDIQEMMAIKTIMLMARGMIQDKEFAKAVMKKEKRVREIYQEMKETARKHQKGGCGVACGTDQQLKQLIKAYYVDDNLEKELEKMYE